MDRTARMTRTGVAAVLAAALLGACSPADDPAADGATSEAGQHTPSVESGGATEAADQQFPDVLEAELTGSGGEFMIAVTISSPYDTPQRYADGWRVLTADGEVLAEHELAHDHANEQPFTRSRGPFAIPDGVDEVVVEGRDTEHGYGGATVTVPVPR